MINHQVQLALDVWQKRLINRLIISNTQTGKY